MTNNKQKKSGLGRGLESLFYQVEEEPLDTEKVEELTISEIRANPYQPRKTFDQTALQELADSIKQSGVFQPIIVRKSTIKGYELIAGERRLRASKLAGKKTIPAIVRQLDDTQMIEIAIVENLQREDLSTLEEAQAYNMMMEKLNLTQDQVAEKMGKSRPYIANYLRLLSLPEQVKKYVNDGKLSMGQARTLLALKDKQDMIQLAQQVVEQQLTVRQIEEIVQQKNEAQKPVIKPKATSNKPIVKPAYITAVEERMQEYFGTTATVHQKGDKGKIEIEFLSQSDFIRILDLLNIHL